MLENLFQTIKKFFKKKKMFPTLFSPEFGLVFAPLEPKEKKDCQIGIPSDYQFGGEGGGVTGVYKTFSGIDETLPSYVGQAKKHLKVNPLESAIEFFPPAIATSYLNPQGSGDRRATIDITTNITCFGNVNVLINGNTLEYNLWWQGVTHLKYLKFDFGGLYCINEAKFYMTNPDEGEGFWQWQGSIDGITWEDIGGIFILGYGQCTILDTLRDNVNYYRYYRLWGKYGILGGGGYKCEFEFKISEEA